MGTSNFSIDGHLLYLGCTTTLLCEETPLQLPLRFAYRCQSRLWPQNFVHVSMAYCMPFGI